MAIVIGPLHSVAASGQIGKCMVFQDHPQRQIVRLYIPTVTQNSPAQFDAWNALAIAGIITKAVSARNWRFLTDNINWIDALTAITTEPDVWPSTLSGLMTGAGLSDYREAQELWRTVPGGSKSLWDAVAKDIGGVPDYTGRFRRATKCWIQFFHGRKSNGGSGNR